MEVTKAGIISSKINRLAGHYMNPTPASQVSKLIKHIPEAIKEIMKEG